MSDGYEDALSIRAENEEGIRLIYGDRSPRGGLPAASGVTLSLVRDCRVRQQRTLTSSGPGCRFASTPR